MPPKSPKLTRRERRRTGRRPQLYHQQQQHVRTEQSSEPSLYLNDLDECCWPCVCLLPPAIPTEPPTEPYTDYPYPDVGEWHTNEWDWQYPSHCFKKKKNIWTLIPNISKYTTGLFQYFPPLLQQKRQSMKNLKSAPPFSNIKVYLCLQFLGSLAAYVEGFIKVKVL